VDHSGCKVLYTSYFKSYLGLSISIIFIHADLKKMRIEREKPFSFFDYIYRTFNIEVYRSMKLWINLNKRIIKTITKLHFLSTCKSLDIVPPHINNAIKLSHIECKNPHLKRKLTFSGKIFASKVTNYEIRDAHCNLTFLRRRLLFVTNYLSSALPTYLWNKFFNTQSFSLQKIKNLELIRIDKKITWLKNERLNNNLRSIKKISYYVKRTTNSDIDTRDLNYSFNEPPPTEKSLTNNIIIDPLMLNEDRETASNLKEKWFINLSSSDIPSAVRDLLSLGEKFNLPITSQKIRNRMALETIKDVENNIRHLNQEQKSHIRLLAASSLERFVNNRPHLNNFNKELINRINHTRSFINDHPSILFTKADKGNVTVALDKEDYLKKIQDMLNDTDTYVTVNSKNQAKKIENKLNECLRAWRSVNYIDAKEYYSLICNDKPLPRAYGLPKIHKPNVPFRIIVSCTNTTLYNFASFLHTILHNNLPKPQSYIKNSFELVGSLSGLHIDETHVLLSLDVVSLFTNVPLDLALEGVKKRWDHISGHTKVPLNPFIRALEFVLTSTFFTFNECTYQQTFGTPMGSPLSPIMADIVLQDLEEFCLQKLNIDLPIYYRYVDDVLLAAPREKIDLIFQTFNSYHPRLKFTMELETNKSINFLDTSISIINNTLVFNWYHKSTFSGRYLNYSSHHPFKQKIGVVYGIVDRAILLSHPSFHKENLIKAIKILLANDFPINLIFKTITRRLHYLFKQKLNFVESETLSIEGDQSGGETIPRFFTLPFLPGVMSSVYRSVKKMNQKLSYRNLNSLKSTIKVHKDKLDRHSKSNVIYKINCSSCDASYVGQTGRQLRTRINEHQRDFYKNYERQSVVSRHRTDSGHDFSWNDTEILDTEQAYQKRLISEMLHIKRQKNGINSMRDTELLDSAYTTLITKLG